MDPQARRLCWHGMLLFLLGLFTGAAIPLFTNPRMGLSAHLGGVQNGMFLLLLGLLWRHLALSSRARLASFRLALASMYAIWIALVLAAALGTSRSTPIAGAGFAGPPLGEASVSLLLGAGSIAIVIAALLLLRGFGGRSGKPADE
jgi:hydroxylaminobenzene mutase